jgi:hypothetical protein
MEALHNGANYVPRYWQEMTTRANTVESQPILWIIYLLLVKAALMKNLIYLQPVLDAITRKEIEWVSFLEGLKHL